MSFPWFTPDVPLIFEEFLMSFPFPFGQKRTRNRDQFPSAPDFVNLTWLDGSVPGSTKGGGLSLLANLSLAKGAEKIGSPQTWLRNPNWLVSGMMKIQKNPLVNKDFDMEKGKFWMGQLVSMVMFKFANSEIISRQSNYRWDKQLCFFFARVTNTRWVC